MGRGFIDTYPADHWFVRAKPARQSISTCLKSRAAHCRFRLPMSENLYDLLWGTLSVATGIVLLQNLDGIARLDQRTGAIMNDSFENSGNSFLNRELWSVGTPSGFRRSRIVLQIAGIISLLVGAVLVGLSFHGLFD